MFDLPFMKFELQGDDGAFATMRMVDSWVSKHS
jgi:hypothetical protein